MKTSDCTILYTPKVTFSMVNLSYRLNGLERLSKGGAFVND